MDHFVAFLPGQPSIAVDSLLKVKRIFEALNICVFKEKNHRTS